MAGRVTLTLALALLAACATGPRTPERLAFALIGDNPYVDFNEPKYDNMIADIRSAGELAWVIHVGDLKGGGQPCSDEMLRSRLDLNLSIGLPFILTPGDNDWFDCHRSTAGGWDPRERLERLREMAYPNPGQTNGSRPFRLVSQSAGSDFPDFVENVYWSRNGVVFGAVHIVGATPGEGGNEIHGELLAAGLAWIDEVFRAAVEQDARGVFLAMQADPYLATIFPGALRLFCKDCPYVRPGYEALDAALLKHARSFGKPVVLAVGDTHIFRVDKPLYDANYRLVENFTRVETFGHPNVHWVRVVVNSSDEVFEFHQELVEANYGVGWPKP